MVGPRLAAKLFLRSVGALSGLSYPATASVCGGVQRLSPKDLPRQQLPRIGRSKAAKTGSVSVTIRLSFGARSCTENGNGVIPRMGKKTDRERRLSLFHMGNTQCPICLSPFSEAQVMAGRDVTL